MTDLCTLLSEKQYPGRGIAIGRTLTEAYLVGGLLAQA